MLYEIVFASKPRLGRPALRRVYRLIVPAYSLEHAVDMFLNNPSSRLCELVSVAAV
jgi:hypothetical protein